MGVVGRVGCGKTSVIAALTAELQKKAGAVFVSEHDKGLGLVTQVSCLMCWHAELCLGCLLH